MNTATDCFDQMINQISPTVKSYKFTIRYPDGCKSEPIIEATTIEEARKVLSYWFPSFDIELGFKELP